MCLNNSAALLTTFAVSDEIYIIKHIYTHATYIYLYTQHIYIYMLSETLKTSFFLDNRAWILTVKNLEHSENKEVNNNSNCTPVSSKRCNNLPCFPIAF